MNCKFTNVLVFAVGAAIGSAVTWKIMKTKYDQIIQEEIDSVKEAFADRFAASQDQNGEETEEDSEEDRSSVAEGQISWEDLEDLDEDEEEYEYDRSETELKEYARLSNMYTSEKGGSDNMEKDVAKMPYVIAPMDFGELDGYKTFELTYYADGVLEDEDYEIVTDVDELLGPKALTTFGEYEEDAVFVRNEKLQSDFQILKEYRTYEEARSIGPNQVDDE